MPAFEAEADAGEEEEAEEADVWCSWWPIPVAEGGSEDGICLYVYGSVGAAGRHVLGETMRGTWAKSGWGP